jgi:hypothetical protein
VSPASYPDVVRRHVEVPAGYRLLCGVSLGYAAVEELLVPGVVAAE